MRSRLLVRHFLLRFLDHDLVSPNADRREVLSVVGGTLIAVSLFLSALIALQYQFNNFLPPGLTSLRSVDERFLFVSSSMLVMALLAVALWDALALDARDAAVLGILPVPQALVIRSKFTAIALLAAGTTLGWNFFPVVLRAAALPVGLPVGFGGVVVLTLAQAAATLGAGTFGFLAIFALREVLTALIGHERFRIVSPALQAVLIVGLTSALLLLPRSSTHTASTWMAPHPIAASALPPFWFVGLHETLAGGVIDRLPRTKPPRFLAAQERDATNLYRSLWPRYHELGRLALEALVIVTALAVSACAWNNRRLPAPTIARRRRISAVHVAWRWMLTHFVARSALQLAGFCFTLQTLPRRITHRAVVASAMAVGVSLIVITASGGNVTMLAAQSLLLASLLTGFRHAIQLPAELRASNTFRLAWTGHQRPYLSGVKRAGFVGVVLPALLVLSVWHTLIFGVRIAALHFATGAVFSIVMMDVLFLRYRYLPLVSAYVPHVDLKSRGPAYVGAVLTASFTLAWIEQSALAAGTMYVFVLLIVGVGLAASVTALDRAWSATATVTDADEEIPLPTQRLNLAG
jgi:hypothetical protein